MAVCRIMLCMLLFFFYLFLLSIDDILQLLPRLYPYLTHRMTPVRHSCLRTILILLDGQPTRHGQKQPIRYMNCPSVDITYGWLICVCIMISIGGFISV